MDIAVEDGLATASLETRPGRDEHAPAIRRLLPRLSAALARQMVGSLRRRDRDRPFDAPQLVTRSSLR